MRSTPQSWLGSAQLKADTIGRMSEIVDRANREDWGKDLGGILHQLTRIGDAEGNNFREYASLYGIPVSIAHLEHAVYESLSPAESLAWPLRFLESIPIGVDLDRVTLAIGSWILGTDELFNWEYQVESKPWVHMEHIFKNKNDMISIPFIDLDLIDMKIREYKDHIQSRMLLCRVMDSLVSLVSGKRAHEYMSPDEGLSSCFRFSVKVAEINLDLGRRPFAGEIGARIWGDKLIGFLKDAG